MARKRKTDEEIKLDVNCYLNSIRDNMEGLLDELKRKTADPELHRVYTNIKKKIKPIYDDFVDLIEIPENWE